MFIQNSVTIGLYIGQCNENQLFLVFDISKRRFAHANDFHYWRCYRNDTIEQQNDKYRYDINPYRFVICNPQIGNCYCNYYFRDVDNLLSML